MPAMFKFVEVGRGPKLARVHKVELTRSKNFRVQLENGNTLDIDLPEP